MDDLPPSVSGAEAALHRLGTASGRESLGTAAGLRRALVRLPEPARANLSARYAGSYRSALTESLLLFLHLSKSGGTALCELAKLNGCWRAGAGGSSLSTNCVDKRLADGPRWLPPRSVQAIVIMPRVNAQNTPSAATGCQAHTAEDHAACHRAKPGTPTPAAQATVGKGPAACLYPGCNPTSPGHRRRRAAQLR